MSRRPFSRGKPEQMGLHNTQRDRRMLRSY